ncbi:outer envelope pore protein 21, chloroplastic-like [Salvia divinorum]|uniref:Outer envelope pore protein 21, chloroplastic-like n=1 Tax=Salvia divinorum TaxID=28513 RepID=A0ABD1GBN3_SALDI
METSFRYGGDSKSLRIHAKEKISISPNSIFQLHGELDTKLGAPTFVNGMLRHFHPELSASLGLGVWYNRRDKVRYHIRGKKTFPVTGDGLVNFNVKGRCNINKELKQIDYSTATELVWSIFNVKKDQDVRIKLGYNVNDKTPYMQVRENNWTFNIDQNRRWTVRYDL